MWPLFAQDPVAEDARLQSSQRGTLSGSKTDGSALVRKLLPAPLPGRYCAICLSFQTPPFLLWLLTRGSREKLGVGGQLGFGGLLRISLFPGTPVPREASVLGTGSEWLHVPIHKHNLTQHLGLLMYNWSTQDTSRKPHGAV